MLLFLEFSSELQLIPHYYHLSKLMITEFLGPCLLEKPLTWKQCYRQYQYVKQPITFYKLKWINSSFFIRTKLCPCFELTEAPYSWWTNPRESCTLKFLVSIAQLEEQSISNKQTRPLSKSARKNMACLPSSTTLKEWCIKAIL